MRNLASVTALAVATSLMGTSVSWAGSAGRKNTALGATALAVGAWSNHTGRAGRKNTAILATAGAAYAWTRYSAKKREENRRKQESPIGCGTKPHRSAIIVFDGPVDSGQCLIERPSCASLLSPPRESRL